MRGFLRTFLFVLAIIVVLGMAAIVLPMLPILFSDEQLSSQPTEQTSTTTQQQPAQRAPVAKQAEPCEPAESKRCQEFFAKDSGQQTTKKSVEFDFGPAPSLPSINLGAQPQVKPEPPAHERVWGGVIGIPVIGGLFQGIATIIWAIDLMLRNIWLVLVVLVAAALITRVPIWVPAIMLWEAAQTLWSKSVVGEVLERHKKDFEEIKTEKQQKKGGQVNG